MITFSSFNTQEGHDKMTIYDGTTSGIVLLNEHSGTTIPASVTATSGTMTIVWVSDGGTISAGWQAAITSECCTKRDGWNDFKFCKKNLNIAIGSSGAITMPVSGADGLSPAYAGNVTYSSSNPSVATVTSDGTVTGISEGTSIITATIPAATINGIDYCKLTANYTVSVGDLCVQIGNSTAQSYNAPIYTYYNNSFVEMIYTSNDIGNNGPCRITSIAFEVNSNANSANLTRSTTIYMANSDKTVFSNNSDWTLSTDMHNVYTGEWIIAEGWKVFTFTNGEFDYTGGSVIIGILGSSETSGTHWSNKKIFNYTAQSNTVLCKFSDGVIYDPSSSSSLGSGSLNANRPNIKFFFDCPTDKMPTLSISNATQDRICFDNEIEPMAVTTSSNVDFSPSLNTIGLSWSPSTQTITGTPNFTGTQTVVGTATSDDGCLKTEEEINITVFQLDASIEFPEP